MSLNEVPAELEEMMMRKGELLMRKIGLFLLFVVVILAGCGKEEKTVKEKETQEEAAKTGSWRSLEISDGNYGIVEAATGSSVGNAEEESGGFECRGIMPMGENVYILSEKGKKAEVSVLDGKGMLSETISLQKENRAQAEKFFVSENGMIGILSSLVKENDWTDSSLYYDRYDWEGKLLSHLKIGEGSVITDNYAVSGDGYLFYNSDERKLTFFGADGETVWEMEMEKELWYDSMAFGPDGNCYLLVFGDKIDGRRLLQIDPADGETKKEWDLPKAAFADIPKMCFEGKGETWYLYSANTGIYRYEMETKEYEQLINWVGSGLNGEEIVSLCPFGEEFLYISGGAGQKKLCRLLPGEKKEKQVLVLGINDPNVTIRNSVMTFNNGQDKVQIKIKNYACLPPNSPATKLQLDIAAGECPDILDQSIMSMESLMDKGAFIDLYTFMKEDPQMQPELFLDHVRELSEREGKLYFMPSGFSMEVLTCRKDLLGDDAAEGLSVDTLWKLREKYPKKTILAGVVGGSEPTSGADFLLGALLSGRVEPYFASEEAKEKLRNLLEFCKSVPEYRASSGEYISTMSDRNNLFATYQVYGHAVKYFFSDLKAAYGKDNYAVTGYPSIEGNGICLIQQMADPMFGISSSCKNKEAAWEFVRSLLTEEAQEDLIDFPVRKEAFEKVLNNGEKKDLTKKEKELICQLVDSAGCFRIEFATSVEDSLRGIIYEEAEGYFSGDKSLDETMKVIESRVNLFASEKE